MMTLCTRSTCLVGFLQCQLTETTVRGQTCCPTRTHYSDSEPTSLCSFSLMLRASWRSNKYILHSLWFGSIYRTRGEHANHYATDAVARRSRICSSIQKYSVHSKALSGPSPLQDKCGLTRPGLESTVYHTALKMSVLTITSWCGSNRRWTDYIRQYNDQRKRGQRQTRNHKTLHKKLQIELHEPHSLPVQASRNCQQFIRSILSSCLDCQYRERHTSLLIYLFNCILHL